MKLHSIAVDGPFKFKTGDGKQVPRMKFTDIIEPSDRLVKNIDIVVPDVWSPSPVGLNFEISAGQDVTPVHYLIQQTIKG